MMEKQFDYFKARDIVTNSTQNNMVNANSWFNQCVELNIYKRQCRNCSLGLATKARACKGAGQE
jgi:hypothetical protein